MSLQWNSKYTELGIDTLSAALFCLSFSGAFFAFRGLEITSGQLAYIALFESIIILLLSRRWYIAPLIFSGSFLAAALVLGQTERSEIIMKAANDYFLSLGFFLRTGETGDMHIVLTATVLMLPVSGLIFFLIRKVSSLLVYIAIVCAVFIPLLIWFPETFNLFLIALTALMIQLPRHLSLILARQRPQDTRLPRGPMQVLAIPVVIASVLLANLVVPANTVNWRWAPLVNRITDLQDIWHNSLGSARSWQAFSLAEYGFIPSGYRLGGPVELSERSILRVKSEANVLIRGISRNIYTGSSWERAQRQYYRFDSPIWQFIRQRTFNAGSPAGNEGQEFRSRFARDISLDIELLINSSTIFNSGRVTSLDIADKLNYPPYFTKDGDIFVFRALPRNTSYSVNTLWYDRSLEGFTEALISLENNISRSDRQWQQIENEYLQLPDGLPSSVHLTASTVAAAGATPYARALLLEQYLRDEFTYSLSPVMPPEDEDFVAHFLETKVGYCVYFATAMVVMARTLGIPARYVEGFALEPEVSENLWTASGQNAHSWAELYFYGIGWLTFDPTPSVAPPDPLVPPENGAVPPEPEITPQPDTDLPPTQIPEEKDRTSLILLIIISALVLIYILARLAIFLARQRHRQRFQVEYVRRRYPNAAKRLDFYYKDVLRQMTCIDIIPEPGETMLNFAIRADKYLRFTDHSVPEAFAPVSNLVYGDIVPAENDIKQLLLLHRRLEERLQESLTRTAYFWKRVLR